MLCGVVLPAFPKSPPEVDAGVVDDCFAPKGPPEELVCPAPRVPVPNEVVAADCEEGPGLGGVPDLAAPPNRLEPELWPVVLGKRLDPPALVV